MQFKEFDWLSGHDIFNNYSPKAKWMFNNYPAKIARNIVWYLANEAVGQVD